MRFRSLIGIVLPIAILVITFLLISLFAPTVWRALSISYGDGDEARRFPSYNDCAASMCGNSTIRYPFGKCGFGSANCLDEQTIKIHLSDGRDFGNTSSVNTTRVIDGRVIGNIKESSYDTRTLQIVQDSSDHPYFDVDHLDFYDYWSSNFLVLNFDDDSIFKLSEGYMFGTILNCTQQNQHINKLLTWLDWGETDRYCYFYNSSGSSSELCDSSNIGFCESCTSYSVIIPSDKNYNIAGDKNLEQANQRGFQITWTIPPYCPSCEATGGRCYSKIDYDHYCVCHHGVYYRNCSEGHTVYPKLSLRVTAEIFFGLCALFSTVVVSCIVVRRQTCCNSTANVEEQSTVALMDYLHSTPPSVENFLNYYSSQVPTRYSYAQIMIYTNNLAEKLGKGGFGTVYKGNLPNGRGIAVKILDESKQSEQQFIAEVATVGTTCHVNLVRLLGYCSQVSIRALVYEYMVNGSLEKYIHGSQEADKLDWKQLYSIALGTARGIAYLHDKCRNRILHFDIKPHNVLLDSNFLPKVADFGLARIADREESHISVGNRGTLGYAAPEMWSRMYGAVTDRSDVYSYGMLVMEIVGERKNMDFHNRESTSSKFFYPEWAFKQVEKGEFGNLRKENISEAEQDIAKRLCLVGLWCIQFNASRRPPMNKVVQMLEGGVEITIPPYPFPVDPPPVQMSASDPSSSTYSLEVQMINPTNTDHIA